MTDNRLSMWQKLEQVEDDFFAPDSDNYNNMSLVELLKAGVNVPTSGGVLGGLPSVIPRAGNRENQPSLLFLNLPESPMIQDPPSTADRVPEKIRRRSIPLLPLFGVSGCGKTRRAIEVLSKNWGFYFNGSDTDWGSEDLVSFLALVGQSWWKLLSGGSFISAKKWRQSLMNPLHCVLP
ncbi:hypothetical protein BGZ74_006116 [Mortierella antarctica]|nr:hypothetical protein BGZ74_006116 [Mortierella antarctica]